MRVEKWAFSYLNNRMTLRRASHAVYEASYHLVWCPKYRKQILTGEVCKRVKALFFEIASQFDFEIQECEVAEDHVYLLISFPKYHEVINQ